MFDPGEFEAALKGEPTRLVALVHAETSTGALQPHIADIAAIAHRHGADDGLPAAATQRAAALCWRR